MRASIEIRANIHACLSCVPRINASKDSTGGILTYTVIFRVEKISKPGVFQQPARASRLGVIFASSHLVLRMSVALLRSTLYNLATRSVRSRTRRVVGLRKATPESFISSGEVFGLASNSFAGSNR